jgi:mannose-6-phosphate isomerase-like protein (cupin superfamily)
VSGALIESGDKRLPPIADVVAPDGSQVRMLANLPRGSMAHFRLSPGQISKAVAHRTVEEIWYVLSGQGRMWRKRGDDVSVVGLWPQLSLTIPVGTSFQFRNDGAEPLEIVAITMPPWPGEGEAYYVDGKW